VSFCRRSVTAVIFALLGGAGHAVAAPCGRPDVNLTFPPDGATNVPPNARLSAHYGSPALYDDEPVSLVDAAGDDVPLSVSFDGADSLLRAVPGQPLRPGFYELLWPGLRSVTGAGVGRGRAIGFFVQTEPDRSAPTFRGVHGIGWDLSRDRDPCTDRLEDRFVFALELGEVDDDAGRDLLQVLVFQTLEPGASERGEPLRVALDVFPDDGKVELRRPADEAGKTCFAAVVQDSLGNVSGGGEREACIVTKKPPFFDGCSVSRATRRRPASFALLAGVLALILLRRAARASERALA
jgi:hypothetical protein